jgi:transglutaminase-like putative cysteine protease
MQLTIRHETLYRYATPARYSIQYLRLTPRAEAGQRVRDWQIDAPGRRWRQTDAYGNVVHVMTIDHAHDELRIRVAGTIETALTPGTPLPNDSPLPPVAFMVPTRLTTPDAAMQALAADAFAPGRNPLDAVQRLTEAIAGRVAYETGSTAVDHTAAEALALGRGVCQDHAHVFLACARLAGYPARYVSGYLDAGGAGATASHAWADVWIEGRGWIAVDVTHARFAGEPYCRLAVGRDYLDASPVRGTRRGGSDEALEVNVQVTAQ